MTPPLSKQNSIDSPQLCKQCEVSLSHPNAQKTRNANPSQQRLNDSLLGRHRTRHWPGWVAWLVCRSLVPRRTNWTADDLPVGDMRLSLRRPNELWLHKNNANFCGLHLLFSEILDLHIFPLFSFTPVPWRVCMFKTFPHSFYKLGRYLYFVLKTFSLTIIVSRNHVSYNDCVKLDLKNNNNSRTKTIFDSIAWGEALRWVGTCTKNFLR